MFYRGLGCYFMLQFLSVIFIVSHIHTQCVGTYILYKTVYRVRNNLRNIEFLFFLFSIIYEFFLRLFFETFELELKLIWKFYMMMLALIPVIYFIIRCDLILYIIILYNRGYPYDLKVKSRLKKKHFM